MQTVSTELSTIDWELVISIVAIVLLLMMSAFFSGSETALTAASRARMHHMERLGNKKAHLVNRLTEDKERLIGSILLGNNLVNILASALATSVLIALVGDAAVAIATVAMTLLVLIFAEVLPKTYAIRNPDRFALAVSPVVAFLVRALSPAVIAVEAVVRVALKLIGARHGGEETIDVADELRGQIELHHREGGVRKTAKDMLGSILELDDVFVSEIMMHRRRIKTLNIDDPPEAIVGAALDSNFTRIPLWQDDQENIVAVLHAKDLARALARNNGDAATLDIRAVAREPWFVPETASLREQLNAFRRRHAHFALVVDEYGALKGIVTLEDILEEIVGDISDEHDAVTAGVRPLPDGSYEVEGSVTIRDLNRRFDWSLPDEEASTIAGLVIYEAQVLPEIGQVFRFHDFTFEILERRRHRINRLKITPPE
jgi:Mg2+/Co2+ transporter CorB